MPDISTHESNLQALKDGTYPTVGVSLGSQHKSINPGDHIPKADTKPTPTISLPSALPPANDETYTVIAIDLDAPFITFNFLSPIAHWIQTDLRSTNGAELKSEAQPIAPWAAANPPPGAAAHRYVFYLYKQTKELKDRKQMGMRQRVRFDVGAVVKELELGDVVGVNYFVSN
ncbi:phosphatidylethanolamine-binding protein, putative [Talaromyces stipitatus ATCC 10500]|uniref:Phosphatidylethanolamine-binding protein, putative n=1 Tax=Talaromyces stipitatus (strain ATCC 10500 / CBS 375.48 / QM 6759 / NRRL 1006) TaxID=441959 RepID=B8M6Z2_TALSN|nr:phosphatidylethanolamine-binding protein, putative [Talaromyces stipitatus ATCC 10500]EED20211.1 phosphatidylethanolamine-binding protein, putative [Talaromyces stipitatus ATCC 10500]